jgi:hypothetical protein
MSYLVNVSLHANNDMQFISWIRVLDSWAEGHSIESQSSHNPLLFPVLNTDY